jgi:hypothetical protein
MKTKTHFIKVVHLYSDTSYHYESKDPSSSSPELIVSSEGQLERDSKSFHRHDGNRTNERADGDINHWIPCTVYWSDLINHVETEREDEETVNHES